MAEKEYENRDGRENTTVVYSQTEGDMGEDFRELVAREENNPLFHALMHWIGGAMVVLNRGRRIVLANDEFAELAGVAKPMELQGKKIGDALGCVHSTKEEEGCGTSSSCAFCRIFKVTVSSFSMDSATFETECRLFLSDGDEKQSIKLRVSASRVTNEEYDYSVVSFRRALLFGKGDVSESSLAGTRSVLIDKVGSFLTLRKVGVGGMGSVYLVKDANNNTYVLKTLREELSTLPDIVARFLKETNIASSLNHPNIVKTFEADHTEDGIVYMIAEYCPGGSVSEWLQNNGVVPVKIALGWMYEAASALSYMWLEHGTIHRDIKPDNLLIDGENRIKITDFGIAKQFFGDQDELTGAGDILGTVNYLAPEQAAGDLNIDIRADLYGLGATFFELLSGCPPFDGPGTDEILTAKLFGGAPPLHEKNPELPASLCRCIDRLLSREPSSRFETPLKLMKELEKVAEDIDFRLLPLR